MNRILRYFAAILITVVTCAGCAQNENILKLPQNQENENSAEIVRYKSGTVLLKDNGTQNSSGHQNIPEPAAKDIHFGPSNINFGS